MAGAHGMHKVELPTLSALAGIFAAHLIVLDIMATPILLPILRTEARDLTASTQALERTVAIIDWKLAHHPRLALAVVTMASR